MYCTIKIGNSLAFLVEPIVFLFFDAMLKYFKPILSITQIGNNIMMCMDGRNVLMNIYTHPHFVCGN